MQHQQQQQQLQIRIDIHKCCTNVFLSGRPNVSVRANWPSTGATTTPSRGRRRGRVVGGREMKTASHYIAAIPSNKLCFAVVASPRPNQEPANGPRLATREDSLSCNCCPAAPPLKLREASQQHCTARIHQVACRLQSRGSESGPSLSRGARPWPIWRRREGRRGRGGKGGSLAQVMPVSTAAFGCMRN